MLKGYGDPTLSAAGLTVLARQVRARGDRPRQRSRARRRVVVRLAAHSAGWKAAFYITESPPLSALIVDRGRVGRFTSRDPALAATRLFRAALARAGVRVAGAAMHGTADDTAVPLASIDSANFAAILRWMDRVSDNFVAEMLVKQLGAVQSGRGTTAAGAGVMTGLLARLASRSQASGSSTAPGSRSSTA